MYQYFQNAYPADRPKKIPAPVKSCAKCKAFTDLGQNIQCLKECDKENMNRSCGTIVIARR